MERERERGSQREKERERERDRERCRDETTISKSLLRAHCVWCMCMWASAAVYAVYAYAHVFSF